MLCWTLSTQFFQIGAENIFVVKDSNRYDMTVALSNQYLLDLFLLM